MAKETKAQERERERREWLAYLASGGGGDFTDDYCEQAGELLKSLKATDDLVLRVATLLDAWAPIPGASDPRQPDRMVAALRGALEAWKRGERMGGE